jgi:hypothetical protein
MEKSVPPTAADTDLLNRSGRREQHPKFRRVGCGASRDPFDQRVNLFESGPRVLPGRPAEVVVRPGKKRTGISQNLQERVILHTVLSNVNGRKAPLTDNSQPNNLD